jgi:peptidoglycan/LPS O-acetylase OafA/YrhL
MTPVSRGLDGLRGLAAFVVAVAHAAVLPFASVWPSATLGLGLGARAAVIIFFVLSGHVIVQSVLAMTRSGGFRPLVYAVNRFARVYPPFLLCLALAWLVALLRSSGVIDPLPALMAEPLTTTPVAFLRDLALLFGNGTPVQNVNAPVWSLRIEIICYAVTGLLAGAFASSPVVRALLLAAAMVLAGAALLRLESATLGFASFALGGLTAWRPTAMPRWTVPALWGATTAVAAVAAVSVGETGPGLAASLSYRLFEALAVFAAAATVLALAGGADSPWRRLALRFDTVAPFSYTLFITHVPVIVLIGGFLPAGGGMAPRLAIFLLTVVVVTVFAFLAARIVERHLDLRRWILARLSVPPLARQG